MLIGRKIKLPELFIFNAGTDLEFAECSVCGHEINPPRYDYGWTYVYPKKCPKCKAEVFAVKVEEDK